MSDHSPDLMSEEDGRMDRETVHQARQVLAGGGKGAGKILPFLGPAFIAAVAYIDPGNFATNIEGGARFGFALLWVVVASNLIALLVQSLSAKLGIATGKNLAELCREHLPAWVVLPMWGIMEIVAMATDLAEFLGAALGLHLLSGLPLGWCGLLTAVATLLILGLQRRGFRPIEVVITGFILVIAGCYLVEILVAAPPWAAVFQGLIPVFPAAHRNEAVVLATGILGATVMPHVIFLHSALTQGRIVLKDPAMRRKLCRYQLADVAVAMGIAGLINAAMLITAATTFHLTGRQDVASIETAYQTLQTVLGPVARSLFGVALLAAGLSSSAVGTMSGQVIMQGFLRRQVPMWVRRLVTMAPALIVIWVGADTTSSLIWSQVVLSFGLPFAVVPLIWFTARSRIMGELANHWLTTAAAGMAGLLIILLNAYLIWQFFAKA
ncbi:MAG: Nramp family divalent metal transporter [Terrimicrobiaceae bacterium]